MRITRQTTAKRVAEQAKDSSRRRITRQDTVRRATERANDASRKKSIRRTGQALDNLKTMFPESYQKKWKDREYRIRRKALIHQQPLKLAELNTTPREKLEQEAALFSKYGKVSPENNTK